MNALTIILTLIFSMPAFSDTVPQFSEIVRKADGSVHLMYQSSVYLKSIGQSLPSGEIGALEYCASRGMHLPSARELGLLSTSLGATGIKELNEFPNESAAHAQ